MSHRYLLLILLAAACVDQPGATVCPTGIVCPADTTCAAAQPICIVGTCGNGRVDSSEACDDGNLLPGDGCSPSCSSEACGNGDVEPGERCDDANTTNGDGCSGDCLSLEECGNGIVDVKSGGNASEKCDDGNTVAGDGCRADCKAMEFCGNGFMDPGEVCDDGMPIGGPCSPDCQSGLGCGNGFLDPGEQCDDGNTEDQDDCRFPSCKHAVCGDGVENTLGIRFEQCDGGTTGTPTETAACNIDCTDSVCGDGKVNQTDDEECDNGTMNDSASCDNDCTTPVCGDGHINATVTPTELCDPGTVGANTVGCDSNCTPPSCGDGHVNKAFIPAGAPSAEGCDDGNTTPGDGCSALCQIESCGNGVPEMVNGEQCDDGDTDDLDGCRNNCQLPTCGDGVHSTGTAEFCDTGVDTAACDAIDCSMPMCNDGVVNSAAGEQCEDGNVANGDGCSSTCKLEPFALAIAKAGNGTGTVTAPNINCGTDCSEIYLAGTMVTITATPDASNTFTGWTGGGCTGTAPCTVTMNTSRNVTATFTANTITIAKIGTGTGTVTGPNINCGMDCAEQLPVGTMVMLMAAPTSDSVFTTWNGGGCGTSPMCTVTLNQATTVTAEFTLNTFAMNVTKAGAGGGTITSSPTGVNCPGTCSASYTANTLVTLIPTPAADSNFSGFTGDCTGMTCAVSMTSVKNVTATFVLKPVTLTVTTSSGGNVSSSPSGINCGGGNNDCSETYPHSTVVMLAATPSNGKSFAGWSGACTGTGACMVTMDAAKSVSATFENNRLTIDRDGSGSGTVTSNPSGINCGGDCTNDYNVGQQITLTAVAATNDVFTGWSGAGCSGTGTCIVTMNGPVTVTANFEDASTLTVQTNGTGGGSVTATGINCPGDCTQDYADNSMQVLTATANGTSAFAGWTNCDAPSGTTCTMTMSSNKTVTATFNTIQFTLAVATAGAGTGTVTSSPGTISCASPNTGTCSQDFNINAVVNLTATAPNFAGWTGDCSSCGTTAANCPVTMTAAKSCTATWTP
jgi:cysteine-rich repeat protein